ncbi:MAG: aminoglycoside phosphotransferase family protein [Clostridia bacterium]|nr:aminoglycoside phosphotransferase family protein [Clostridia bacterium]
MNYNDIKYAIRNFKFEGEYKDFLELKSGNINSTCMLIYEQDGKQKKYILQRINKAVFQNLDGLMNNISAVVEHIGNKIDKDDPEYERKFLNFVKTKDDKYLYSDEHGSCWRAYIYVDNTTAYDSIENPELFYEAGRGFGSFQRHLDDFPVEKLVEIIPKFHDTRSRFFDFIAAISKNPVGRVSKIDAEIDFFFERRKMMSEIVNMIEAGIIPVRVTHNDTKLNNILIDNDTGKAMCVIDLDTVMPGSVLYDFGDAIRFGASTAAEDEPDTSKITLDMELFKLFAKGFLEETEGLLSKEEIRFMPLGVKIMTCELAMRFLTDYINGDTYFKIKYPEHNLVRARAQIKLLTEIEAKYDEMVACIDSLI